MAKGNGKGWGGPAKGAGHPPFNAETAGIAGSITDPAVKDRKNLLREKVMRLYEKVVDDEAEPTPNRLNAGDKLLDRIDGKPAVTNINLTADDVERMSDADLAAELTRLEREAAEAFARAKAAAGPGKPH